MTACENLLFDTVEALFLQLEEKKIRYAVLRNYDNYPVFGHDIDLILHHDDLHLWREIAVEIARNHKWDALTECQHWAKSSQPHHQIEVFRFYRRQPLQFLQVDLFHGYMLWSLPFIDENNLLLDRVKDERGFTRINPGKENLFRMLQLERLLASGGFEEKATRYIQKIIENNLINETEFLQILNHYFDSDGSKAYFFLKKYDFQNYRKTVLRIKRRYLLRNFLANPTTASLNLYARFKDYFRLYFLDSCGFAISAYKPEAFDESILYKLLNHLMSANILTCWNAGSVHSKGPVWGPQKVKERGGLVISWVKHSGNASLCLKEEEGILPVILQLLIERHQKLFEAAGQ